MKKATRKIPTAQSLANIALHYLGRYAASESSLRHVLNNRIRRVAMENTVFKEDLELHEALRSAIEMIIEKHKRLGSLNDAAFAETKLSSLRRQGRSRRTIIQKLSARGVKRSVIDAALAGSAEADNPEQAEFDAALALAKKRKIGPFREGTGDLEQKRKDFAALARAGFCSDIIKKVFEIQAGNKGKQTC